MIPEKILLQRGGTVMEYKKNQAIFYEGNMPHYYYQIAEGSVKMVSVNENGREFIQGNFKDGESFGEPVILINKPYPATALAKEDSKLIRIRKEEFVDILKEYPDILFSLTKVLARRVYHKSLIGKAMSIIEPETRIMTVLKMLMENNTLDDNARIDITRQQIADMIGFRVETVIRTIKKLEKKGMIKIIRGKIYL